MGCRKWRKNPRRGKDQDWKEIMNHLVGYRSTSRVTREIHFMQWSTTPESKLFSLGQTSHTEPKHLRVPPLLCPTRNLIQDTYLSVPWTVLFCPNIFAQALASSWKAPSLFSVSAYWNSIPSFKASLPKVVLIPKSGHLLLLHSTVFTFFLSTIIYDKLPLICIRL